MDTFMSDYDVQKVSTGLTLTLKDETLSGDNRMSHTIIFRYIGEFSDILNNITFPAISLLNRFAVGIATNIQIRELSFLPEILYIDITRQMVYEEAVSTQNRLQSCFPIQTDYYDILQGNEILVGVVDSGIDLYHPAFFRPDGTNRIVSYWDQAHNGNAPYPYGFGTELDAHAIQSLSLSDRAYLFDLGGHGTAVASIIAALSPAADMVGVATLPNTAAFLCAVDYIARYAISRKKALVLNLSYGNNYGDHLGNSIVELYLDSLASNGKFTIVAGMGNDGNTNRHKHIQANNRQIAEIYVSNGLQICNLQLWSSFEQAFRFRFISPQGIASSYFSSEEEGVFYRFALAETQFSLQIGQALPFNQYQEIFISFSGNPIDSGIWKIEFVPIFSATYSVDAWLPVQASTSTDIFFTIPDTELTLTIPASSKTAISVGAYDSRLLSVTAFSGNGSTRILKPDLVAPGVDIVVANAGGTYTQKTGTSFATPFVTAACANLMQWGITDGHDPFLYGERLKAYLHKGAIPLPNTDSVPNIKSGYGSLCASNSLPEV